MKKSKFTEAQIVFAIKQSETGVAAAEICQKMGISGATFYNWKMKYAGPGIAELRQLRQLQEENSMKISRNGVVDRIPLEGNPVLKK